VGAQEEGRQAPPGQIPEDERDYYLERIYPSFGNLVPRDVASRAAKQVCDEGRGVGPSGLGRLPRLRRRHQAPRRSNVVAERYGNLFEMYEKHHRRDPYERRCASTPPCTTRWAGCGWTTT
jgi:succinate dehydrogenase / fumarate reductase flavoprotein subunit